VNDEKFKTDRNLKGNMGSIIPKESIFSRRPWLQGIDSSGIVSASFPSDCIGPVTNLHIQACVMHVLGAVHQNEARGRKTKERPNKNPRMVLEFVLNECRSAVPPCF